MHTHTHAHMHMHPHMCTHTQTFWAEMQTFVERTLGSYRPISSIDMDAQIPNIALTIYKMHNTIFFTNVKVVLILKNQSV